VIASTDNFDMATDDEQKILQSAAGLCASCQHARRVESARGSIFVLCQLSATDPHFPKYPRLPVLTCPGYMRAGAALPS
jgi:hypothetical protein